MLKSVPARRGQQELEIARRFSSPDLRRDSRNHCVPLLETLELPDTLDQKLMAIPYSTCDLSTNPISAPMASL